MMRAAGMLTLLAVLVSTAPAAEPAFTQQTRWIMGTALTIHLPSDRADEDSLFAGLFEIAAEWDGLLSPWQDEAPLTRLGRGAGTWVTVPAAVLDYLERAVRDARRTGGIVDITLTRDGALRIEVDRDRSRARIPVGSRALDPGADGKGVALDAMAVALDAAGITSALVDFGGSSFLARGDGPDGVGWNVALAGPGGSMLGALNLRDTAVSVSSSVQRRQQEDGAATERFHLIDLRTGEAVNERRTAVVLAPSATDAEVLSTAAAVLGVDGVSDDRGRRLLDQFPDCAVGLFEEGAGSLELSGFADAFTAVAR